MALCVVLVWKIHHHLWGSMNAKYKIGKKHWIKNKRVKLLVIRSYEPRICPKKIQNLSPSTCHRCWWPFWGGHRKYQKHKHSPLLQVLPKHWYWLILVLVIKTCSNIEILSLEVKILPLLVIITKSNYNIGFVRLSYSDNTSSAALVSPSTRLSADWKLPKSVKPRKGSYLEKGPFSLLSQSFVPWFAALLHC